MNSIAEIYINEKGESGDRIKIYPDILLKAARNENSGAVRLWFLAKHLNAGGCGAIPNKALRQYVINDLKVKRGTYDIWLARALHIGIIQRKNKNLLLAGYTKAAAILGVEHVKRPIYIPLENLIKKGWLSWVWAAWLLSCGFIDKPISRATLRGLSGIPERNQLEYEKKAGVINHANYAKHRGAETKEDLYRLLIIEGRPVFDCEGQTLERLPNSREIENKQIQAAPKGRTRRVNSQLKDLSINGGRDSKQTITRRYCQGEKQADKILKRIGKLRAKDIPGLPDYIYQAANKQGFWRAIPA